MTTFALVHGAWHGAWCWEHLIPELERHGHSAVAMDLPVDDPNARTPTYAETVVRALDGHDDIVLVGHSLGGIIVPAVAERVPVRRVVYLCGVLRDPGRSMADGYDDGTDADMTPPGFSGTEQRGDGSSVWTEEGARKVLYQDCPPELAAWAFARLRPQYSLWNEVAPNDDWPGVPSTYILCEDDACVSAEWARRVVPVRLGVDPVELPGGHSPFLSRPADLADVLAGLA